MKFEQFTTLLKKTQDALHAYLQHAWTERGYPDRSFYGELFASLVEGSALRERMLATAAEKYEASEEAIAHQEFHLYGLGHLAEDSSEELFQYRSFPISLKEKTTNWLLLRAYAHVRYGGFLKRVIWLWFARVVVMLNQRKDGLIIDRRVGRIVLMDAREEYCSDQYHAFMLMVLLDLYEHTGQRWLLRVVARGYKYLEKKPGGAAHLSRGRGREQVFGYASLLYVSTWLAQRGFSNTSFSVAEQVLGRMSSVQNKNGALPLVLVEGDDRSLWRSYNNLFDYLPFTLWVFSRVEQLMQSSNPDSF